MPTRLNILIVDADSLYGRLAKTILKEQFDVTVEQSPFDAIERLKKERFDLLIADYNLPGGNGIKLIEKAMQLSPGIESIMTGEDVPTETVEEAIRKGAIDFFRKPFDYESVKLSIERTKKYMGLNKKLQKAESKNEAMARIISNETNSYELIGSSLQMKQVNLLIEKVAASSDTSVLITGESGSGKELVARAIHTASQRRNNYFGAINMSAITDTLFESEFFGHIKGSFTGAIADRSGWFEIANHGTLFLDEIGDMPHNHQLKLLRVLEDRKYIKVGSQKENHFDIRIIAATNKEINELKMGHSFRSDLYHRLAAFEINIPPLRERNNDIELLINHFSKHFAAKMNKKIKSIEPALIAKLKQYNFPGNVRELRNMIERAVILSDDATLSLDQFSPFETESNSHSIIPDTYNLEEIEKQTIIKALEVSRNNKTNAAKLLNITWNSLHRRLEKYQIGINE